MPQNEIDEKSGQMLDIIDALAEQGNISEGNYLTLCNSLAYLRNRGIELQRNNSYLSDINNGNFSDITDLQRKLRQEQIERQRLETRLREYRAQHEEKKEEKEEHIQAPRRVRARRQARAPRQAQEPRHSTENRLRDVLNDNDYVRYRYRGETHYGIFRTESNYIFDEETGCHYYSLSSFAQGGSNRSVNGWRVCEIRRFQSQEWFSAQQLRA